MAANLLPNTIAKQWRTITRDCAWVYGHHPQSSPTRGDREGNWLRACRPFLAIWLAVGLGSWADWPIGPRPPVVAIALGRLQDGRDNRQPNNSP
jgi:hypothetical protein